MMINTRTFYSISKYVTYGLKFLQALVIAKFLGPVGLGVYGFAQLIALYTSFVNFGIPTAIHTVLSVSDEKDRIKPDWYISVGFSFLMLVGLALYVCCSVIVYFSPSIFSKFRFGEFGPTSVIIGVNLIVVQFFANIYQVYGQYFRIALNELIGVLLLFLFVYLFREDKENLIKALLYVSALLILFNLIFFFYKAPFRLRFYLQGFVLGSILKMGIPMLIMNVGFYLIVISVRTISSYNYSLHDIGLFTLGLNVASTVLMGLNAVGWTYYSTIIANTCSSVEDAYKYIQQVNRIYNFTLCLTIYAGIVCLPIIFYILPAYSGFSLGFIILLLAQIFTSLSFGYGSLLIAQKKQSSMAIVSILTLLFAVILSSLVCFIDFPFYFQTIVILLSMVFYSFLVCSLGARVCKKNIFRVLFFEVHNFKVLVPVLLLLYFVFAGFGYLWIFLVLGIYLLLSFNDILFIINILRENGLKKI